MLDNVNILIRNNKFPTLNRIILLTTFSRNKLIQIYTRIISVKIGTELKESGNHKIKKGYLTPLKIILKDIIY